MSKRSRSQQDTFSEYNDDENVNESMIDSVMDNDSGNEQEGGLVDFDETEPYHGTEAVDVDADADDDDDIEDADINTTDRRHQSQKKTYMNVETDMTEPYHATADVDVDEDDNADDDDIDIDKMMNNDDDHGSDM